MTRVDHRANDFDDLDLFWATVDQISEEDSHPAPWRFPPASQPGVAEFLQERLELGRLTMDIADYVVSQRISLVSCNMPRSDYLVLSGILQLT